MAGAQTGWDPAIDAAIQSLDPNRVSEAVRGEVRKAFVRIGLRFVASATKAIRDRAYEPNSEITQALKGSSTPLVNDGDLMASLTYDIDLNDLVLWLGASKAARNNRSVNLVSILRILHDGGTIDVARYPKIRRAIFARLQAVADGRERGDAGKARAILERWRKMARPKGKGGVSGGLQMIVWEIPPRRFIEAPLGEPSFQIMAVRELDTAVRKGITRALRAHFERV